MRIGNRSMDSSRAFLKGVYLPYLHTSFELVGIYLTIWGVQIFSLRVNDGSRAGFCSVMSEEVQVQFVYGIVQHYLCVDVMLICFFLYYVNDLSIRSSSSLSSSLSGVIVSSH